MEFAEEIGVLDQERRTWHVGNEASCRLAWVVLTRGETYRPYKPVA